MIRPTRSTALLTVLSATAILAGCDRKAAPVDEDEASATAFPSPDATGQSIIRPDMAVAQPEAPPAMTPLRVIVPFAGMEGDEFDEAALDVLREVAASPQLAAGGAIIVRGHSDAGGSDSANMRVSRGRAEQVRDWLIEEEVSDERITIIAFGEQNPLRPNANPDGTANDAGRAANRRVEIEVALPAVQATPDDGGQATNGETNTVPTRVP